MLGGKVPPDLKWVTEMTKRKDERRELLKDDDVHSFLERVARYIQQNSKQVAVLAVGALIVLAVFFMWINHLDTMRNDQAKALYGAEKILDTDIKDEKAEFKFDTDKAKLEAGLVELEKVISGQSGIVKQQAILQKVGVLVDLGRQSEVEALYQGLIATDRGLKVFGLMGLGDFFQAEGRYADAREQFGKLEGLRGAQLKDLAQYKTALCFKEEGNLTEATSQLKQLVQRYEKSEDNEKPPVFAKARQLLDELEKDTNSEEESS